VLQFIPNIHHQGIGHTIQTTVLHSIRLARVLFLLVLLVPFLAACSSPFASSQPVTSHQLILQKQEQQTPTAHQTYVAIGASDTYGIGSDDPDERNWPADLTELLGPRTRLVNLGVPGIHAHGAIGVELPVALEAHPDLVTVWLAVNDLADQVPVDSYALDLDRILNRLHTALPHARIVVANVPDLSYLPRFQKYDYQSLEQQIQAYNAVIATIVARYHVTLVDLYSSATVLANHPEYVSSDGFHPNDLGYLAIAQIFYGVLQKKSSP
jgi:acyl-CoA thioesterase I